MAFVSPNLRPRFLFFFVNGGKDFLATILGSVWKCLDMFGYVWCVCPLCGDFNKWLVPGRGFFWMHGTAMM